ncbi:MAG: alkaline phosphatase family protein [Acidobacteriota bacterium]|nr:alkaline phosphatase family protein [Acidobacteriota bacterium]
MKRLLVPLLFVCGLPAAPPARPPRQPKLVLAIVVDQFRYDYLTRFRKDYTAGFARMLDRGAVFTDAHYIHVPTVTAVGHSTFLSGAPPSLSGIIANDWFDRETGKRVTSVSDPAVKLLGGSPGRGASSPRRLLVSTLGDELKMSGKASKVIGISIKDRSAILPAGRMADAAYWYDDAANTWVSSTWYFEDLPQWVKDLNTGRPAAKFAGVAWKPFAGAPDAPPFCIFGTDPCKTIENTPFGNEILEEFAERAIASERLGQHSATDLLAVSFSANDYVGHRTGPDSPEVRDISIRTDRTLGKLLDFVDARLGPGNTLVILTADHGVAPIPEVNQARKMPGGWLSSRELSQVLLDALTKKYGPGSWLAPGLGSWGIYLNLELIHEKKLEEADVERTGAEALRAVPHILRVYTRTQLLSGQLPNDDVSRGVRIGFFAQRSANLFLVGEPYYVFGEPGVRTSHGSPFNYDTHVPVIFMGPRIKPGNYHAKIAVNDIAPTLATILGVESPSGSIGRVLTELLQ